MSVSMKTSLDSWLYLKADHADMCSLKGASVFQDITG